MNKSTLAFLIIMMSSFVLFHAWEFKKNGMGWYEINCMPEPNNTIDQQIKDAGFTKAQEKVVRKIAYSITVNSQEKDCYFFTLLKALILVGFWVLGSSIVFMIYLYTNQKRPADK